MPNSKNDVNDATQDVFGAIAEFTTAVKDIEAAIKRIDQRAEKAVLETIAQKFDIAVKQAVQDNIYFIVDAVEEAQKNQGY